MSLYLGRTWDEPRRAVRALVALGAAAALLLGLPAAAPAQGSDPGSRLDVIVRGAVGPVAAEAAVEAAGGTVERRLGIIDGVVASVPAARLGELRRTPGVAGVTLDARIEPQGLSSAYDPANDLGSLYNLTRAIQAPEMWKKGYTGAGVGIALIDSGVLPVEGLRTPGKIVNGPDLSFESQEDTLRYLDTYGHGTHMAGIMAGRDDEVVPGAEDKKEYVTGVAPGAHVVNIKVADAEGATDVSQVIAAIDWVVQHRNDPGLNIRVLNLSFGTDGTQDYRLDPLSYAAEVAWRKGIVVVAAAGNSGYGTPKLNNPAYNPFLVAVGAVTANGTPDTKDDVVPAWSSRGDGVRNPDVVAPGTAVTGFRAPGSFLDQSYPGAVRHERFFSGSGTSQAAAAVSGAAALVVQQRPLATPDQVKRLLMTTASTLPAADPVAQGSGMIDLKTLLTASTPRYVQGWEKSTGTGSLDLARGSARLSDDGIELAGEQDIFGHPWDGATWAPAAWEGRTWAGGDWNGRTWAGDCWCGVSWAGRTWAGRTWAGRTWAGRTWAGLLWTDNVWTGRTWAGGSWAGRTWAGRTWAGNAWSSAAWGG